MCSSVDVNIKRLESTSTYAFMFIVVLSLDKFRTGCALVSRQSGR